MNVSPDDLCFTPAIHLAAALQRHEVSSVELTDAVLHRIDQINPHLNAFTIVLYEEARAAARQAEQALLDGDHTGPLCGIPFTIKDLTPTRGVKTMMGSRAMADYVPAESGILVERLLAAGGIFLGKTTTPEMGNKGITESPLTGTTNNPWKLTHTAGGSSGGAAAAVAAGLGPLAEGSDGGGSIRIPASCCGVVGFKPTFGLVPFYPMFPGYESLVHQGPITRTIADAALMLNVMAGYDPREPYAIPDTGIDYVQALAQPSVCGLRIAYSPNLGLAPVDPQVAACTEAVAQVFTDLGAQVEEATPETPDPEQAMMVMWSTVMAAMTGDVVETIGRDNADPALVFLIDMGAKYSAVEFYTAAHITRNQYYVSMMRFFQDYDLLLSPTLTVPPFPHPEQAAGPPAVADQTGNALLGWLLTYPFNMTGQPAISVPCGFSDAGLPIGAQIVGRRLEDTRVLQAAAAYEQAAPWAERRPGIVR
jgi:Asp-tRNA(Asn)/Glu-tRNA(Gln) amidotransferase A subunit family amidase